MRNLLTLILILVGIVYSELSLEINKKVNDEVSLPDKLKYSYLNPLLAYLLLKNDFIANIRFYNSLIKPAYTESGNRTYSEDIGTDSFSKSPILLFPSPTGILETHRNIKDNFARNYFSVDINNTTEDILLVNIKSLVDIILRLHRKEVINLRLLNLKEATEKEIGKIILTADKKSDEKLNFIIRLLSLKEEVKSEIGRAILTNIKDDEKKLNLLKSLNLKEDEDPEIEIGN